MATKINPLNWGYITNAEFEIEGNSKFLKVDIVIPISDDEAGEIIYEAILEHIKNKGRSS